MIVRNDTLHGIVSEDGTDSFKNHAKGRQLRKEDLFACEELTNYAAHAVLALRYAIGVPGASRDARRALPERPAIPEFLRKSIAPRNGRGSR